MSWSAAKVTPLLISTVRVAASPSAISPGSTDTANVASSLSSMTTCAEPASAETE